ncbi:MAG TPA: ATP-binding protein [Candidatus Nanopelagicaceae bacterium]
MRPARKRRLVVQLLLGQSILIGVAGLTLIGTALLLAPPIFLRHMREAGIDTSVAQKHISEAFTGAFSISLAIAMASALVIAGIIAWYMMRRITQPIERLAVMAEALASGISSPETVLLGSTPEIDRLATALTGMASELSEVQEEQARMLRDVAHELRTPIATIGALVDGIEDGVVEGNAHSWNTIRDQLNRLNRLSRDVRDVSQSYDQSLSTLKAPVKPLEIGASAISAWTRRFDTKGVHLEMQADGTFPTMNVDPIRVGQILSNLLENALRHTPKAGSVFLMIANTGAAVTFTIRDTGEGIAAHQLPHIFERLYRGDNARRSGDAGSGLGLTIARKIAESHGSSLTAASEGLGHGSTFTLTLPLSGQ